MPLIVFYLGISKRGERILLFHHLDLFLALGYGSLQKRLFDFLSDPFHLSASILHIDFHIDEPLIGLLSDGSAWLDISKRDNYILVFFSFHAHVLVDRYVLRQHCMIVGFHFQGTVLYLV
jgi:hypothetical protein